MNSPRRNLQRRIDPWGLILLLALGGAAGLSGCGRPTPTSDSGTASSIPSASTAPAAPVPVTNMVAIPAGSFLRIKFPVSLTHDFWIGKYEVTQHEFATLMGRNPSHFQGDSNRPVEKVTFVDASNYCAELSRRERTGGRLPAGWEYRLPTEAEWEYACRAGSTNRYSFGNDSTVGELHAWTGENSEAMSHPVGMKQANAWGLYDMHGNVWEWCSDWFEPYPARPLTDPVGPSTSKYKVFKGGGWNQDLPYASASSRFMMSPSNGIHFVGFRVALGRPPAPPTLSAPKLALTNLLPTQPHP